MNLFTLRCDHKTGSTVPSHDDLSVKRLKSGGGCCSSFLLLLVVAVHWHRLVGGLNVVSIEGGRSQGE